MSTVTVALDERSYPIHIDAGIIDTAGELMHPHLAGGRCLIIADATVASIYGERLGASLRAAGIDFAIETFPAGEPSKHIQTCEQMWQACGKHGIDRSGAIIALGGGVSGDLAGFVASTWMRGIRFIQVPTSLLAMVDSSVGGKTGVNSVAGKNLIGAFYQPSCVIIDTNVVATMEPREYRAGLAEVIKYGVIRDEPFFSWIENNATDLKAHTPETVEYAVRVSCEAKAWYVVNDEKEHGVRAHLNYGHTFGHTLERDTQYTRYLHGEAVGIGMCMAVNLSEQLGILTDTTLVERQETLLKTFELPTTHTDDNIANCAQRLTDYCYLDKKARKGKTSFIAPTHCGHVERCASPDDQLVRAAFTSCLTDK